MNKKILSLIILFLGVFSVMQAQNDGKIRVKVLCWTRTTRQPIALQISGLSELRRVQPRIWMVCLS